MHRSELSPCYTMCLAICICTGLVQQHAWCAINSICSRPRERRYWADCQHGACWHWRSSVCVCCAALYTDWPVHCSLFWVWLLSRAAFMCSVWNIEKWTEWVMSITVYEGARLFMLVNQDPCRNTHTHCHWFLLLWKVGERERSKWRSRRTNKKQNKKTSKSN